MGSCSAKTSANRRPLAQGIPAVAVGTIPPTEVAYLMLEVS